MQDLALVIDFCWSIVVPKKPMLYVDYQSEIFLLSRKSSIISLSLYKNYKLIVYLGHLENPD